MTGSSDYEGSTNPLHASRLQPYQAGTISGRLLHEALIETRLPIEAVDRLLRDAGLSLQDLKRPSCRVEVGQYADIWLKSAALSGDEFFGMCADRVRCGSFAFITKVAAEMKTLRDATICIVNFYGLLIERMQARLVEDEDLAYIVLSNHPTYRRPFSYFTYWLMIHGLMCFLIGQRIAVVAIDVALDEPDCCEDYKVLFTEQIRYGQPGHRIAFRRDVLQRPIRVSHQDVRCFLSKAPANILVKYRNDEGVIARITAVLRQHAPERWPSFEDIAERFQASPSTLRRQLEAAGVTFQDLKDAVRRERAIALLNDPASSISEVAAATGFTEASSFHRAFRRWTGLNPGEYRDRILGR